MDNQYSSQPVDKPSKWILSKWRRPNFRNETSPDKCNEMQGEGSRSNEAKQPQQIKKRKWAIPDDEEVQQGRTLNLRWTILPPSFVNSLLDSCNKNAIKFANGKFSPFPSFFDIDYVYFPLCFGSQDWSLIMIDLNSLDLVMYNNKRISGDRYRERVHPSLKKIAVYFTTLLVNIRYWKVKRRQESNITYGANDDYIRPENEIYGNEALYVCMLMEHLVT
ncbi:hypothetical protein E3N88_26663 [Mikania micrantha]|uniref:Ubiquitin-like protease family profile domain-containing protein n=1 Tax=Mikania micrantha TaxID=192012 RepID=A0A5N6MXG4_9ASTR|nr:hypothetical protein E3N88_26663 [Mikania micrantha]